jgi:hypothetical protein
LTLAPDARNVLARAMLHPSTQPKYYALLAEPFEATYLAFPRDTPHERWARLIARWLPDEADALLGLDADTLLGAEEAADEADSPSAALASAMPPRGGTLDYAGRGVVAARVVCEAAVAECGREVWEGSDAETLSTLVLEFPPANEDLEDDARRAWVDLWSTFKHQEAEATVFKALPWWVRTGYENDFAGLSSPAFLRDLATRLRATGVVDTMIARLSAEGFGEDAKDLPGVVAFLEDCARQGRWALGLQGR